MPTDQSGRIATRIGGAVVATLIAVACAADAGVDHGAGDDDPALTTTDPRWTGTTAPPTPMSTATATATTTGTRAPDAARLEECEREAGKAEVTFQPNLQMPLGETTRFRAEASIPHLKDPEPAALPRATTTVVPVRLRCEVQATLRGKDFLVDPGGSQEASFLDRPTIVWSWDVEPLRSGSRVLTLEIKSVAQIGGRRIPGAGGELYEAFVTVNARPERFLDKTTRWSEGLVGHPLVKGLASLLLLLGTLAGMWRWLLRLPWPWKSRTRRPARHGPSPRRRKQAAPRLLSRAGRTSGR